MHLILQIQNLTRQKRNEIFKPARDNNLMGLEVGGFNNLFAK